MIFIIMVDKNIKSFVSSRSQDIQSISFKASFTTIFPVDRNSLDTFQYLCIENILVSSS